MVNALTLDAETGFLQSINPISNTFTAEKKMDFLRQAREYRKLNKGWPDFGEICERIGVNILTLERHIKIDEEFAKQFKELSLSGKYQAESDMYNARLKNPLYMFGWLRKWFPDEYHPEYRANPTVNIQVFDGKIGNAQAFIEAETVDTTVISPSSSVKPLISK
jgi:hypothetical protein